MAAILTTKSKTAFSKSISIRLVKRYTISNSHNFHQKQHEHQKQQAVQEQLFSTTSNHGYQERGNGIRNGDKEASLLSFLDQHSQKNSHNREQAIDKITNAKATTTAADTTLTQSSKEISLHTLEKQELEKERIQLFQEAKAMTLSLYRTCIRCTKRIRHGNAYDEEQFQIREDEQKSNRIRSSPSKSLSFEPPVDRDNELESRALYYLAFTKEAFGQEVDCLTKNKSSLWREEDISRFIYLLKQGEERRRWILKDYKFDDPYCLLWDANDNGLEVRLDRWDERANDLIEKTYRTNGWLLKSDFAEGVSNVNIDNANFEDTMDDDDWDDDNDDGDDDENGNK